MNRLSKGNRILIGLLVCLLVMIVIVMIAISGLIFGWFDISRHMKFNSLAGAVEVGERIEFSVENYKNIGRPVLSVSSEDENIAICMIGSAGNVIVTGINPGTTTVKVIGKGCKDQTLTINVADSKKALKELGLEDSAIQAGDIDYYFLSNGDFFSLSDYYGDYIGGKFRISVMDEMTFDSIYSNNYSSVKDELDALVENGKYYLATCDIIGENLGGSVTYGGMLNLIMCSDGYKLAIYDEGWDTINMAGEISMPDEDWLLSCIADDFILDKNAVSVQGLSNTDFSKRQAVKETWRAAIYKDTIYFEVNGDLYQLDKNDIGTGKNATKFMDFTSRGKEITLFSIYEDYLIYGMGNEFTTDELRVYNFVDKTDRLLSNSFAVRDLIIYRDKIYCTDYKGIVAFDFSGNMENVWQYNTFAFDINGDYIYIFDGNSWEVVDVNSHDDMGYIVTGIAGAYETDVVTMYDDRLFFTSYESQTDELYLNILGMDGKLNFLGEALRGASFDTFNGLYYDSYIFFTANAGETLYRTDVKTGERVSEDFKRYGYYYTIELMNLDGMIMTFTYDQNNVPHYLLVDPDTLTMSEVEEMNIYSN